jgi:hypothetical protein
MKKIIVAGVAALMIAGCGGGGGSSDTNTTTASVSTSASSGVTLAPLDKTSAADLLHLVNTPLNLDMFYWDYVSDMGGIENISEGEQGCDNGGSMNIVKKSDVDLVVNANKCEIDGDYFDGSFELKCSDTTCREATIVALTDVKTSDMDNIVEKAGFTVNINIVSETKVNESLNGEFTNENKEYKVENWTAEFSDAGDGGTYLKYLSGRLYINNLQNYVDFDKMIEDIYYPEDDVATKGEAAFRADGGDIYIKVENGYLEALINNEVVASEEIKE